MKVVTTEAHYRKYAALRKKFGVSFLAEKVLGLTPEQMRAKLAEDRHLNNCGPLQRWDAMAASFVGRNHDMNVDGVSDGTNRRMSLSEGVSLAKHAVTYHFCGAEPEFDEV